MLLFVLSDRRINKHTSLQQQQQQEFLHVRTHLAAVCDTEENTVASPSLPAPLHFGSTGKSDDNYAWGYSCS